MSKVNEANLDFAKRLLELRQQHSLTQEEFAQRIGVTRQAVSRWEMGISTPSSRTLFRISEEFKIPLDKIIVCGSNKTITDKRQAVNSVKSGIVLLGMGVLSLLSLPFLAEMKQIKEMEVFKSAYEHSYHYIIEFPLFIILISSFVLLSVGTYLLLKRRLFYEEKND